MKQGRSRLQALWRCAVPGRPWTTQPQGALIAAALWQPMQGAQISWMPVASVTRVQTVTRSR
jgi:hypothetical protein